MEKWRVLRKIWEPFQSCDASVCASSSCYYWIRSALPAFSLLLSLPGTLWTYLLLRATPQVLHPVITELLKLLWKKQTLWSISLSGILTLWSASKGTMALLDGMERVMEVRPCPRLWQRQLRGVVTFLILLAALIPISGTLIFRDWLFRGKPRFQVLFSVLLLSSLVWLLLRLMSKRQLSSRSCAAGGFLIGCGWIVLSWGFAIYVRWFSSQVQIYGFLGLGLMAMIWLRSCLLLLLYGCRFSVLVEYGDYHPFQYLRAFFVGRS